MKKRSNITQPGDSIHKTVAANIYNKTRRIFVETRKWKSSVIFTCYYDDIQKYIVVKI